MLSSGLRLVVGRVAELEDAVEREGQAGGVGHSATSRSRAAGSDRCRHLLGQRQRRHRPVRGGAPQRVHRALQAEQDADGSGRHLGPHRQALGVGGDRAGRGSSGSRRRRPSARARPTAGRPDARIISSSVSPSVSKSGKSETTCSTPRAGLADGPGDADELLAGGGEGRRRLAPAGAVVEGARGGEAERAGADPLGGEAAHLGDLLGGGRLAVGAPLAHDEEAHRPVADLGGEVDVVRPALEGVEVLADATPSPTTGPRGARRRGCPRRLPSARSACSLVRRADRGEPDAAVAHDDRRDAVARRRLEAVVPGGLAVVVGVDVDEAGGDEGPVGVDLAGPDAVDRGPPRRCGRRGWRRPPCGPARRCRP